MFKTQEESSPLTLLVLIGVYRLIFPAIRAEFSSDYPLPQAVQRLREVASPISLANCFGSRTTVGEIGEQNVWLQVFLGTVNWGHYPMRFDGKFQRVGDNLVLSGQFTLTSGNKAWMLLWIGGATLFTVGPAVQQWSRADPAWWSAPLFPLVILVLVIISGRFCCRHHSNVPWLSKIISQALVIR